MVTENELAAQTLKLDDKRYRESMEIGRFGDIGMSPCCKHTTCFQDETLYGAKLPEIHSPALSVCKTEPVLTPRSVQSSHHYNCTTCFNPHNATESRASDVGCRSFTE
jgi:hypothetical protein